MKSLFILLFLFSISNKAYSWGKTGHRIVGHIAQENLNQNSALEVKKILGYEVLSQVSNWADLMRSNKDFDKYKPWHYVSIADKKDYKSSKKNPKGDAVAAMVECEDILRDKKSTLKRKQFALKYLVHIVGDIHQPLHAGRSHDRGGNTIKLKWFGKSTNLHRIWDENLIELQKLSYTEYANYIHHVTPAKKKKLQDSYFLDWVKESMALRSQVYDFKAKKGWEWSYNYNNIATLNRRILEAGVRLAGLLNNIFDRKELSFKAKKLRKIISKK